MMNEQKLIELWNSGMLKDLPEINFAQFERNVGRWQKKMKRKTELDIVLGAILAAVVFVFAIYDPRILYFVPPAAGFAIWYYLSLRKIYSKAGTGDESSTKRFLESRILLLSRFIRTNRILGPFLCGVFAFASLLLAPEYASMFRDGTVAAIAAGIVLLMTIIGGLLIEVALRLLYVPMLDSLNELLADMD